MTMMMTLLGSQNQHHPHHRHLVVITIQLVGYAISVLVQEPVSRWLLSHYLTAQDGNL